MVSYWPRGVGRKDSTNVCRGINSSSVKQVLLFTQKTTHLLPHSVPWGWSSVLELSWIANKLDYWNIDLGLGDEIDCAGSYGSLCKGVLPEYFSHSRIRYATGPLSTTLTWVWKDGVDSDNALRDPRQQYDEAISSVDSQSYLDLNLDWRIADSALLSFTVTNLTDNKPPLLGEQAFEVNTHPGVYDVLGRRYQARISYRF